MPNFRLRNISKLFKEDASDSVVALRNISIDFIENEVAFIIGTNGSGKSSLLNILAGSISPTSGQIFINNVDFTNIAEIKKAKYFGRLFQDVNSGLLPSYTVAENFFLSMKKCKSLSPFYPIIKRKQLEPISVLIKKYAPELLDKMGRICASLSGGEKQLVSFINTILVNPPVLLLDEPTAALDVKNAEIVFDRILEYNESSQTNSAIIVTHNLSYAFKYATRIILLHQGEIISIFNPKETDLSKIHDIFFKLDRAVI